MGKKKNITIDRIKTNPEVGLTKAQVKERNELGLNNDVKKKFSKTYLSIFIGNIFTFFNLLGVLVVIALLNTNAKPMDYFFVIVYIANILIGIIQEIRAKISIDKLSLVVSNTSNVIRDGEKHKILSKSIVLDDIIELKLGNQVPTDCILVSGEAEVNESLLTGESIPVKKVIGDTLLRGSFITSGTCIVRADKVGKNNYVEKLSTKAKRYKKPHSELMDSLRLIIKSIGIIIIPMATIYLIKSIAISKLELSIAISRTCTVIIGMIPSGMFLLTSLALAVGTIKLAKNNTMIQDLYSLEMLARVDTICFDKTGTITDGRMFVKDIVSLSPKYDFNIANIISSMLGVLKDNNQTAIALYNKYGHKIYFNPLYSLPFNSQRKYSAVTFDEQGTFAFGAPEFVLSREKYGEIEGYINQYTSLGLRVLLLANSKKQIMNNNAPDDFIPVALILLVDNIRKDAFDTVRWFKENGVDIKVISGDNPITVSEVSKRVGIENADQYVSLEGLSDNEVFDAATKYTIFGRVSPEQKAILIKALKTAGHTTAMTGDGVNDILALKESDCAVSVASGSEAARNIAHIVLMDNNFASMPKVVLEGRRVINNVQSSSSLYLMKTFFTIIFAALSVFIVSAYPFTLKQMNILELLVIGLPSFFLSLQPNEQRVSGSFMTNVLKKSLSSAVMMCLSVLFVFIAKLAIGTNNMLTNEIYTTLEVFALTYAGVVSLFNICKPFNIYRGIMFTITLFVIMLLSVIIIFFGLSFIGMNKLIPFSFYWPYILIVVTIVLFDISIESVITRIFDSLKIKEQHKTNKNIK